MKKQRLSTGRALVRTVAGNQLGDAIFDLAEVALDQNLPEGVLKATPVVSTLVKLARMGQAVFEELHLRKLENFLVELNAVSVEEREILLERYPDSSEEQRVLGENLLLVLERLDDIKKPAILARFFAAYIRSEIDYLTFTRLARALERFNVELLPHLRRFYTPVEPFMEASEDIIHELSLAGLVTVSLKHSGLISGSASYCSSELGKTFLRIGFGVQPSAS
ncbi:MAG: hypothetical protein KJ852_08415 [Gammaproteobacteria bacterium]|nr:hypothetical protein [Gammaproteobacteria bacterium]MBU0786219.1 hypothetical protein [Gammaproteobacteria bacterium]MBU0816800.1 hypothetical protein [Gammaproteobacteria bacterium]MBU1786964.1 hypothetical protein [Gammaproteobacteria bacterium]